MESNPQPSQPLSTTDNSCADWDPAEIDHMLQYLKAHKSEIVETGNFRPKTYNNLLPTLAPLRKLGPIKTAKNCSYKWGAVSS